MKNNIEQDVKTISVKCCKCTANFPLNINQLYQVCFIEILNSKDTKEIKKKSWLFDLRFFIIHLVIVAVPLYISQYYFNTKVYFMCMGFYLLGNVSINFAKWLADII